MDSLHHEDGREDEEEKAQLKQKTSSDPYNHPYKKYTSSTLTGLKVVQRGWLEMLIRMGVARPVLYLSRKRVTLTDTKPDQHRFQLTTGDIFRHASHEFRELAEKTHKFKDIGGVDVKIMDRHGNKYHNMKFKYIPSSDTFRFNGPSYGNFLVGSSLKENQLVDIWGLPKRKGDDGETWFAFVNYWDDHETVYVN